MKVAETWKDYELIATSRGQKLERWKDIYLLRPDPQVIWDEGDLLEKYHSLIHAVYHRSNKGGGSWDNLKNVPNAWKIDYKNLTFNIKQMGFKHTGLFPEQAVNWDFMIEKIKKENRKIKVLNLFAYTGGATVACLSAGASVTHVDASRGMVDWCKENVKSSGYENTEVRYLVDDVIKFVKREIRRGNYLVSLCTEILSDDPLFFLINSYTTGLSSTVLKNILTLTVDKHKKGKITCGEIGLRGTEDNLILPCGIYGRWEKEDED